jgi:hypothetical protein
LSARPATLPCRAAILDGEVVVQDKRAASDFEDRRFKVPWSTEPIPGGYVVKDASGNSLAYVYGRETREQADTAKVLTMDEARRVASNIAKLPTLLRTEAEEGAP